VTTDLKRKRGESELSGSAMAPATEAEELAALDKALTALGFTDDAKLERVLHVLTPRVVEQMASAHASTKKKAMEILTHVNKRLAAQPSMKLPLEDLVSLYVDEKKHKDSAIVKNFALVYVERAFERADVKTRAAQILRALEGVSARSAPHREIIARAAVDALAVPENELTNPGNGDDNTFDVNAMKFLHDEQDRRAFLQHCLDYLLYQPNSAGHAPAPAPAPSPVAAAMRGIANVAGVVTEPPSAETAPREARSAPPPPGMSPASVARVLGPSAKPPATRELAAKKLALLHFFRRASDATVPPPELLMHYLVASCDADHEVSKLGDDLLRRRCVWDTNRPSVNLEDPKIAGALYRAFLGGDPSVPETSRAAPASPAMKLKLVNLLCRSVTAANCFPLTVQTIFTCLYGEGTTTRLKAAGMELAVWVLRHATDAQLKQASPLLLSGMLKLLDNGAAGGAAGASGGGAAATAGGEGAAPDGGTEASASAAASTGASNVTAGVASLRGFCYQALGQLSARTPALVTGTADIAARVFGALASEPEGVRASVQGAARALARAYKGCGGGVAMAIEGLLLSSIDASASSAGGGAENSRRLVAAQWARELFPFDHVPARYLCVVAAGDAKADVREEGRAGLRPPGEEELLAKRRAGRFASEKTEKTEPEDEKSSRALPSATSVLAYLRARHPELGKPAALTARLPLPPLAMAAALAFAKRCVAEETAANPGTAAPEGYRLFLEHCLVKAAPPELTGAATEALLELVEQFPETFAEPADAAAAVARVRHFAAHVDAPTRRVAAKLCGVLARWLRPAPAAASALLDELLALAGEGGAGAGSHASSDERGGVFDAVHGRFEHQDGALRAAGFVAASGAIGDAVYEKTFPPETIARALRAFVAVAGCKNPTLAGTAAEAIGHVGLAGLPPLPRAPPPAEKPEKDLSPPPAPEGTVDLVVERLLKVMRLSDEGAAQRAARAAGYVIAGGCEWCDAEKLLDGLFRMSRRKSEETQLAVGEALCFAFGGVAPSATDVLLGSFTTLEGANKLRLGEDAADAEARGRSAGETGETAKSAAAAPIPAAAAPAAMAVPTPNDTACECILSAIFDTYLYSSRPEERCAACTWLLALVTHARRHEKLVSMLPEIQEAFGSLLGDQNELTQEMASRGVSVVYELGTEAQRKELLGSLMGTLSGEKPKRRRVKLADDTAVFSEGAVRVDDEALKKKDEGGGGSGGSLSTYKELCSIVTDIGQPDLIYKFMDLANYQAMLNSSKGAAFGFASIAKRAGDALAPHLAKLLPKLYRMQHDPSPKMQEAVKGIWVAVVDDPKAAVDAHFAAVMEDLLAECGSRTWRSRQSAASALAELLSGRRFAEVEPFLERVWTASLRSVDDIKETVREAGKALCRTTRGLTVRLCDAHHSDPAEARRTITVVAPILLQQGLLSPVKEIQSLAMDVLMRVAKHAGSAEIRPFVPEMVKCLLEALSSMEDSRLNYIEQHAPAIGVSAERLEHARLQSSKASPMGETLDVLMGHVDEATMTELVPQLGSVLRSGVGLNTRAGTCRFISRLCLRRGSLVRPHAGKLFKALLAAAAADKSQSVTSAAVSATAAVARHATEARTHQLVRDVVAMYERASDGDDDSETNEKRRALASHLVLELSRNASDAVAKHACVVLPVAFVGRFDDAENVANRWREVWEENAAGASSTLRLYLDEILSLCASRLTAAQYRVKRQGAVAVAAAAKAAPDVVTPRAPEMLRWLTAELPGRVWEGKEAVPGAVADVLEACPACAVGTDARLEVVNALVAEAGRKKADYRKAAIEALRRALAALAPARTNKKDGSGGAENVAETDETFTDDFFPTVAPLLRELLGANAEPPTTSSAEPTAGGNTVAEMEAEAARVAAETKTADAVADLALRCLATLCAGAPRDAMRAAAPECASLAADALAPAHSWTRRAAACAVVAAAAARVAGDSHTAADADAAETWLAPLAAPLRHCATDLRVSQLRVAAAEALAAAADALRKREGSATRAACVKQLEAMRDDDRAPDVRGAAGRALAPRGE
jgi:proteasome component ECM29